MLPTWGGWYLSAVGKAKDITCPECLVPASEPCKREEGQGFHVLRGRMARWIEMGLS